MAKIHANMDMDVDTPTRERSNTSSTYNLRELSANSSISSILYVERIKIQNNNPSWAD